MSNYSQYFKNREELLRKLERLHEEKYKLKDQLHSYDEPLRYKVELSGLPRTGKSTCVERVYDFFKEAGFKVGRTQEPADILKQSITTEERKKLSPLEFNNCTMQISKQELSRLSSQENDLILEDRGVIDNYFWYQKMYNEGIINLETFERLLLTLATDLEDVDHLFIMLAEAKKIIERDYMNQIFLEERTNTTLEGVRKLRASYDLLMPRIKSYVKKPQIGQIDTSNINVIDTSIIIADDIMLGMTRKLTLKRQNNR